jgi:PPOX class probable F420-dependent enzyme
MEQETVARRLAAARVGRLATVTASGAAHVVPCCFAVVGDHLVSAVDGKPKTSLALRRLDNLRANPAASMLVDHYVEDWAELWWVRVDGPARVVESGDERTAALGALAGKYAQYRRSPPPGPVIVMVIERTVAWP